jgi:gliding motility-associated-like protein
MKYKIFLFVLFFSSICLAQENCENGIDDDGDGKIDLNDSDCACANNTISSLINNYNFEQKNYCPNDFAQFNATSNWFSPSTATTDYINSCGFIPASATDAGIYPFPSSNGNGVAGIIVSQNYKEFIAICTNTTLIAGTKYQLNFDIASSTSGRILSTKPNIGQACNNGNLNAGRLDITLYGKSNCDTNIPPNTNNFPDGWQEMGTATYLPTKNWNQLSIIFTPSTNINSIMLGSPYNLPNTYVDEYDYHSCFPYFYFDNLLLNNASNLGLRLSSTGSFCENSLILNAEIDSSLGTTFSYQWYKDGIAILGATTNILSINYNLSNIGNYQYKINNSNSCRLSPIYNVNNVIDMPNYTIDQSPCFPGTTTITMTTSADEYSFDNGATWSTKASKSDLTAYYNPIQILIKKNGCISSSRSVILKYPPLETVLTPPNVIVIQPGCQTNGSITVTTPALEYSFDGGITWTINPTLNNLPPNLYHDYKVRIKTLLGCITTAAYVVMQPFTLPDPTYTQINSSCGNGGSITFTSTSFEYSFNRGLTWTANPTALNLAPGDYFLQVRNNLGCVSSYVRAHITTNYLAAPLVTITHPTCESGGVIQVNTTAAFYSFDDGPWTNNPLITNLLSGYHRIRTKDLSNCESYEKVVYLNTFQLPNPTYSLINPSCSSENNTGITITIITPATEYSFNAGLSWTSSNVATNLTANSYYLIKIRNNANCESGYVYVQTLIQQNPTIAPTISIIQPVSCNLSTGTINVTTTASLYSYDNGITYSNNSSSPALPMGTYFVKIKKTLNDCESLATTAIINAPPNAPASPTINVTQPISCVSPFGSINVTSSAFEYSFDDGLNYSNNPNSGLLAVGNYQVKVRNSSNCESTVVPITIIPPIDYPSAPIFTVLQPNCSNAKGKITVTSFASEYSFDNGLSWVTSSISDYINSGNHLVKIKNANGCVSNASTVTIIPFTNFPLKPTTTSPQTFCIQQNAALSSIAIMGQNIKWYDALTNGNLLANTTLLQNGTTYYASQTINNCESERIPVLINIQNTATPTGISTQTFCSSQNPTLNTIVITGTNTRWYGNLTAGTILPDITPIQDGQTYYATQTLNGCESPTRLAVTVAFISTLPTNNCTELFCDDLNDGTETVNLSSYNSSIISNTTDYSFTYFNSLSGAENETASNKIANFTNYKLVLGDNKIYVRINSNTPCYAVAEIKLTLFSKPIINIQDIVPICENNTITIDAGAGFDSYLWSNGATTQTITVANPGDFSITVTDDYDTLSCSSTKNFTVKKSNKATINTIETKDWTDNDNVITVFATGNGDYEYSIDGFNYQTSNQFTGLNSGKYTILVRDKNGCGTATNEVYLLMFPRFFTPNGDGYNDTWKIKSSEIEAGLTVKIFDRYGKIIKILSTNADSWDGTYNGTELSATDYWFVVTRSNGIEYKGHFSLKR